MMVLCSHVHYHYVEGEFGRMGYAVCDRNPCDFPERRTREEMLRDTKPSRAEGVL